MAEKSITATPKPRKPQGRISRFAKGVLAELKKVRWPNAKQLFNYTVVVIVTVIVVSLLLGMFDGIFAFLLSIII